MLSFRLLPLAACGLTLCSSASLGKEPDAAYPSATPVVLISIDTLRSDRLPAYGYSGVRTPAIDALRLDGILFEHAFSPVPLTLPAHTSLLSGQLPVRHGVRDNLGYRLEESLQPMLQERLRELGYSTGAAISAYVLRAETGMARGFDFYDDRLVAAPHATAADVQRSGVETLRALLPWLQSVASKPFLLLLHLYEPHSPYEPPEPFASAYSSAYDAEIAAADQVVGQLLMELKRLGVYDRSLVVLLSDHGEGLGGHGESEHGILLYRQTLQIPLIVKLPGGSRSGETVSTPVQLTDIAPTVLSVLGVRPAGDPAGSSLLEPLPADRAIYGETFYPWLNLGWSYLLSMISGRYHYIQGPDPELYDLWEDPEEKRDLLLEQLDTARGMRLGLRQLHVMPREPAEADDETIEALRSLGYLGSAADRPTGKLPDPKTRIFVLDDVYRAKRLLSAGQAETAVRMFRAALETDPGLVDAWQFLGLALRQLGKKEEALVALREAYRLSGGPAELATAMSQTLFELGKPDDALEVLAFAIESSPENPRLHVSQARVLLATDRLQEALAAAETALSLAPEDPEVLYVRGSIHLERNDRVAAEADLRRALEINPGMAEAARDLAVLLMETGRGEEAIEILENDAGGTG